MLLGGCSAAVCDPSPLPVCLRPLQDPPSPPLFLASTHTHHPPTHPLAPSTPSDMPVDEKMAFLRESRHAFGRTALVLSGGGSFGAFHMVGCVCGGGAGGGVDSWWQQWRHHWHWVVVLMYREEYCGCGCGCVQILYHPSLQRCTASIDPYCREPPLCAPRRASSRRCWMPTCCPEWCRGPALGP